MLILRSFIKKDVFAFKSDFKLIERSNVSQGFKYLCYEQLIKEIDKTFEKKCDEVKELVEDIKQKMKK